MSRRSTLYDIRYSNLPKQIRIWKSDFSKQLLDVVWRAYENYYISVLSKQSIVYVAELERSISMDLFIEIRLVLRITDGFEAYEVVHEPWELSSVKGTTGRPKQPDIAFVLLEERRVAWPLDAKILTTDGDVAEYIKEVKDNFLTCEYAPYSSEGAMIGYLLSGDVDVAFTNISAKSGFLLQKYTLFLRRDHYTSNHQRTGSLCINPPHSFCCHHLLMKLT